ncbi:Gfo/Idh/MocA family oxidoreductase [Blastopirellula sp. J2-11]|uniref:Gfo/Idh/MocA family protein n=1 Tax=Blastopirellula sp. J2-11 TaxID=2943192 RepID=UPI0021C76221|nr:Gfo/Idh/MocA family oxidoreductase [Blastopirellula sp. J2-11]UUO04514.1 Gfo/Idh/MocA family oxidoreductase [Blastopirellula sp. J2-11]
MNSHQDRRHFIKLSTAASAGFWAAAGVQAQESNSPNEQINFASIGIGGKGSSDSTDAGRAGNMVAIVDIDKSQLEKGKSFYPDAKTYTDYREMLTEMGDKVDAVTVSTPDHTHAAASAMAMKMGKHCFTQKPLTHSIWEARRLGEIAKENKVVTQMGNQGTAQHGLRRAAEIIQAGGIGTVNEIHVWTNRPIWPQGIGMPKPQPVPDHIDWEMFIGPAPFREYADAYHPAMWRGWWDFGTGALGDMACHTFNMPFMALNLRDPISVVADSSGHNGQTYPKWSVIKFEFPELNGRAACTVYWYDGGQLPSPALTQDLPLEDGALSVTGSLLIGDAGKIYSPGNDGSKFHLLPEEKYRDYKGPKETIPRSPGHFKEFVNGIKGGPEPMSNFPNYAGPLTETILLGNLSVWTTGESGKGKIIQWDAKNLVAKNAPEVADIIKPKYREGWADLG